MPRSGNPQRQRENADVFGFTLTDGDREQLARLHRSPEGRLDPATHEEFWMLRQRIARLAFRLSGWTNVGELPRRGIFVGAPHTSMWDYVFVLMVVWSAGMTPRILVKKELFRPPASWLLRATGAVTVDRENPAGLVDRLAEESRKGHDFVLVLAAEGTRSKGEYWKSGFYRLAQQTGLPVVLGFVDGPRKTIGVGGTLVPTGDVRADMDRVRAFYADKPGLRPELRTGPRLREEA